MGGTDYVIFFIGESIIRNIILAHEINYLIEVLVLLDTGVYTINLFGLNHCRTLHVVSLLFCLMSHFIVKLL